MIKETWPISINHRKLLWISLWFSVGLIYQKKTIFLVLLAALLHPALVHVAKKDLFPRSWPSLFQTVTLQFTSFLNKATWLTYKNIGCAWKRMGTGFGLVFWFKTPLVLSGNDLRVLCNKATNRQIKRSELRRQGVSVHQLPHGKCLCACFYWATGGS